VRLPLALAILVGSFGCTSLPKPKQAYFSFPKDAYIETPKRTFHPMGTVRSRVNYPSLDVRHEEQELCRNYFNKAVIDLVRMAKERGADAVIEVQSVVFLEDGRVETFKKPECADDGEEGQALAQGVAVKWKRAAAPPPESPHSPFALPESQQPKPRVQDRVKPRPSPMPRTKPISPADPVVRE
jgi:hypothetical protein